MPPARITSLRIPERPNLLWVELATSEGLTGLGAASRGAAAVEAQLHDQVAPYFLGQDARHIERHHLNFATPYVGFGAASGRTRAAAAVDIAL